MTDDIKAHYTPGSDLAEAARKIAQKKGFIAPPIPPHVFAAIDEMHIGGVPAALHLFEALKPQPGMSVLDIGCGIGGPARVMAAEFGCHVTGVDLSPPFCVAAKEISTLSGLDTMTAFEQGDALALPFVDNAFDMAYTIHAAMNISGKDRFYAEAARVLKTGALFGLYDVMAGPAPEPMTFPVPWAGKPEISHLQTAQDAIDRLHKSGFEIIASEDRTTPARAALDALIASGKIATEVMGDDRAQRIQNLVKNIEAGRCTVWQIIARRV